MSTLDVRQLPDNESLDEAPFPAGRQSDFRVHLSPAVHQGIASHAGEDTSVEICGVLVGTWKRDADGPYAVVTDYIRCDSASSKFAEVTFTHESWAQINEEMDNKYADSRIIGWYHSHPDFGIFLSDRDCFIQENFFSGAGQVAYVVDPVRKLEGIFEWRDGSPQPVSHYWVGDRIIPREASEKSSAPARQQSGESAASDPEAMSDSGSRKSRPSFDLLAWLCLFLLGYLLASTTTRWEQEKMIQGAVAHYGVIKLMRLGFEQQLSETRGRLGLIGSEVDSLLAVDQSKLDDSQRKEFDERKQRVSQALSLSSESLRRIEEVYGYSDLERTALAAYIATKEGELMGLARPQNSAVRPQNNAGQAAPSGQQPTGQLSRPPGLSSSADQALTDSATAEQPE